MKKKKQREAWRGQWEQAYTAKQLARLLAKAKPNARVYAETPIGAGGVTCIVPYVGKGGGCYGQPTILLCINSSELTKPRELTALELLQKLQFAIEKLNVPPAAKADRVPTPAKRRSGVLHKRRAAAGRQSAGRLQSRRTHHNANGGDRLH